MERLLKVGVRLFHTREDLNVEAEDIYGFSGLDINGNEIQMDQFRGKVVLFVNVATN
jgi:hypothetical protein